MSSRRWARGHLGALDPDQPGIALRLPFGIFLMRGFSRGLIAAGVTIAMLPVLALYLLLQRRFIEGITAGALKT